MANNKDERKLENGAPASKSDGIHPAFYIACVLPPPWLIANCQWFKLLTDSLSQFVDCPEFQCHSVQQMGPAHCQVQ